MLDRVGQMVMVGFHGKSIDNDLKVLILDEGIGGIILFSRNIESKGQLVDLTNRLQELAFQRDKTIPLLISIDQEGGRVFRLPPPFTQFPSYGKMSANGDKQAIRLNSENLAKELIDVGINMNMAPVIDVNTNPDNPIIGDRAFGDDPRIVAEYGQIVMKAFQACGIIPVGKHFPGHGDTETDSHLELPVVRKNLAELKKVEFFPFQQLIKKGLDVIMTAHILYPLIEPSLPATVSPEFLTTILREYLEFQGVIISDDIEMKGMSIGFTVKDIVEKGVLAGLDIFLCCHTLEKQKEILRTLMDLYKKKDENSLLISKSIKRVAVLKKTIKSIKIDNRQING